MRLPVQRSPSQERDFPTDDIAGITCLGTSSAIFRAAPAKVPLSFALPPWSGFDRAGLGREKSGRDHSAQEPTDHRDLHLDPATFTIDEESARLPALDAARVLELSGSGLNAVPRREIRRLSSPDARPTLLTTLSRRESPFDHDSIGDPMGLRVELDRSKSSTRLAPGAFEAPHPCATSGGEVLGPPQSLPRRPRAPDRQ